MVIVASGMVRGRLATTSPQHSGHSPSVEGFNRNEALVFARFSPLVAATQPQYSQQSTVFAEETELKNLSLCIIHSVFGGRKFFLQKRYE